MNRWLKKIQNVQVDTPPKPREAPLGGLGGVVTGAFEEKHAPSTASEWLDWIASEVPLVPEDRVYVWARLMTLPPGGVEAVARRYVQRWQEAADAEPKPHRKDNAGRRAANRGLLYLVEPGGSGATRVWLGWMKGGRGDDLQRRRH